MTHLIDKDKLVAEITKIYDINRSNGYIDVCNEIDDILSFLDTLEVKDVDFPCDENRDKELALSLQIQAYLNTASDELYGKGKPLYSKSHLEGIHECMKMWAKLHDYYFYKNTCENKEVDLEKEYKEFIDCDNGRSMFEIAKHFFELGLKAKGGMEYDTRRKRYSWT